MTIKMLNENVLKTRVKKFQKSMGDSGIDASNIRTLSSFMYFTGIKWLRPSLLIPSDGDPTAFVVEHEADEFLSKTWVDDVVTYRNVEGLMKGVTGRIRDSGYKVVGFDYSVERDSYVAFFELFKRLNPKIEVSNVHELIMSLRMIKDDYEINFIKEASRIAEKWLSVSMDSISIGASELDIAAEAIYAMMKAGAESPHVYVNASSKPRAHAEPRSDVKVDDKCAVMVVVSADYMGYNSNITRTLFIGKATEEAKKAHETLHDIYAKAKDIVKPSVKLIDVENIIKKALEEKGYEKYYLTGFAHGVGLLVEEDPITTILVPHRQYLVAENMVLAFIHAPLMILGIGSLKCEDTFLVKSDKVEPLTKYECEAFR
ncbi:MAG: aminopeptidase P family protein [archaeon]|nr:aminopeptidase P family protein [archaeon]